MRRCAAVAALALAACSSEPREPARETDGSAADTAAAPAAPAPPSALVCEGLETSILAARPTRAGLSARFGEPDSTAVVTAPNRHVEGATDSLFTIFYPGLIARVHWPEGGADLPDLVSVDDNRYLAFPSIGIGVPAEGVAAALGVPTRREADALVYDCGMDAEQPVRFELGDGRVRRVVIDYYVD